MTTKRIVYTRPDGGLSIIAPTPDFVKGCKSLRAALAIIRAKDVPKDAVNVMVCDAADLPQDRTYRDAWCCQDSKNIEIDMPKARDIHMGKIRASRNAALEREDTALMRAVESGNESAVRAVAKHKQKLRDIPQTFDLSRAETPDELKSLWPDDLPEGATGE